MRNIAQEENIPVPLDLMEILKARMNLESYNLDRRVTSRKIILNFLKKMKEASETYNNAVKNATSFLVNNYARAKEMENQLGEACDFLSDEDDEAADSTLVEVQKDGTKRLLCPVLPCRVRTFKLRRHLQSCHSSQLSDDKINYAIEMALIMESNKGCKSTTPYSKCTKKRGLKSNPSTFLVNRKDNYKKCSICGKLVLNMTNHIQRTHSIKKEDPSYKSLVTQCEVVPQCFIKQSDKSSAVILTGDELATAQKQFSSQIEEQKDTLEKLKALRTSMEEKKKEIEEFTMKANGIDGAKELDDLKMEWNRIYEEYKSERYRDSRKYSPTTEVWKKAFVEHLNRLKFPNSNRLSNMTFDIIVPYEIKYEEHLNYKNITNGSTVRRMLAEFSNNTKLNCSSQIKYVAAFEKFLKFLILDPDSPENRKPTNVDSAAFLSKDLCLRIIESEIANHKKIVRKNVGREQILSRKKAKSKLISKEETDKFLSEIDKDLKTFLNEKEKWQQYSQNDVRKVRNNLMAAAILRLGRRSKEIMRMTTKEVEDFQKRSVNGENFYIIEVLENKSAVGAKAAAIVFNDTEFTALRMYIQFLRTKIVENSSIVFPSTSGQKLNESSSLTFGGAWKVLQRFSTQSGKKLSSRVCRSSKVTNSRLDNITLEEERKLALAMNHSHDVSIAWTCMAKYRDNFYHKR